MKEIMTEKDVCEFLQIGPTTVWRWLKDGLLPMPIRVGRSNRWFKDELVEFLKGQPRLDIYADN